MPEKLKELTEHQSRLLDLLFSDEYREALRKGDWSEAITAAGYAPNTSKAAILRTKLFREKLEERLGEYQVALEYQAIMVNDDVLSGAALTPLSSVQLSSAKDILDRSKKFVKRSETKHEVDAGSAIVLLPAKDDIDE